MTERYELSRRKTLAGIATIGAAGAGAGLGTSALFSDEESFENNIITAGTLDMTVEAQLVAANDEYIAAMEGSDFPVEYDETADGETEEGVTLGYEFEDFKPGDWVIICYDVSVADNPGYVVIHGGNFSQDGGTTTEPEPTPDDGELADNLLLTHWNDYQGENEDPAEGSRSDLLELSQTTNVDSIDPEGGSWGEPDIDGNATLSGGPDVQYTDVLEFLFGVDQDPNNVSGVPDPSGPELGNGYASTDGVAIREGGGIGGPGDQPYRAVGSGDDSLTFYQLIELPSEVGNEVQGDTLSFDLGFVSEQSRNNDGPTREYPFENQEAPQ